MSTKKSARSLSHTSNDNHERKKIPLFIKESELKETLEAAISSLPEKQRVAFLLSRMDGKTYKEIAEILGISRQAVEKRIYNALDTLRKFLLNPLIRWVMSRQSGL